MVNTSIDINDRPSAFRYPRGNGIGVDLPSIDEKIEIGKGRVIKEGKKIAIINFGARLSECLMASENLSKKGVNPTIVDARFAKPLDENLFWQIATDHEAIISIEEGSIGGFGSHLSHFLSEKNLIDNSLKFRHLDIVPLQKKYKDLFRYQGQYKFLHEDAKDKPVFGEYYDCIIDNVGPEPKFELDYSLTNPPKIFIMDHYRHIEYWPWCVEFDKIMPMQFATRNSCVYSFESLKHINENIEVQIKEMKINNRYVPVIQRHSLD